MRIRWILCAAFVAALLFPAPVRGSTLDAGRQPRVALVGHDNVELRASASGHARVLTVLVQQSQVEFLGSRGAWSHVRVWASVEGWLKTADLVYRAPWESVSTYRAPEVHYHLQAHAARTLHVSAVATDALALKRSPGGATIGWLAAGKPVAVTGWQQDAAGKIWYRIGNGWALGDGVQFDLSARATSPTKGLPLWTRVAGKGMWLTLGTFAKGDPNALIVAAQKNGITHLYLETAISPLGFHGKKSVGEVIDAAHRHHLAVIAWVYPYLYDVAADVDLTRRVANFRTPSGARFDGIAADLERNVQLWNMRAYSQLVRAYLGSQYLLVGVPYPPQSFPDYPFSEMARTYNVIAPMDYWHQTKSASGLDFGHMSYGFDYARRYASDSVSAIHRADPGIPIAPIGQTFDNFGRLEMGPYAPSSDEIRGFLAGSKQSGAIGASFFQWMTATDAEWQAIRSYRF